MKIGEMHILNKKKLKGKKTEPNLGSRLCSLTLKLLGDVVEFSAMLVVNSYTQATNVTSDIDTFRHSYLLLVCLFCTARIPCALFFSFSFIFSLFGRESGANNRFINRPMKPQIEAVW